MQKRLANLLLVLALCLVFSPIIKSRFFDRKEVEREVTAFRQTSETSEEGKSSLSLYEAKQKASGVLTIPSLDLVLPIYAHVDEYSLSKGAAMMEGYNDLSGKKHAILTSHNGLSSSGLFTNLNTLKKGDLFMVENAKKETLYYRVETMEVVLPTEKRVLEKPNDTISLITCDSSEGPNSHRLVVTGKRSEAPKKEEAERHIVFSTYEYFAFGVTLVVLLLLLWERRKTA